MEQVAKYTRLMPWQGQLEQSNDPDPAPLEAIPSTTSVLAVAYTISQLEALCGRKNIATSLSLLDLSYQF